MRKIRSLSSEVFTNPVSFGTFCDNVQHTVEGKAKDKAYNDTNVDGPNLLDQLAGKHFPGHSLGEIFYKTVRFMKKRESSDLEKIAAWAFLEWRREQRKTQLMDQIEPFQSQFSQSPTEILNAPTSRTDRAGHGNLNKRSRMQSKGSKLPRHSRKSR